MKYLRFLIPLLLLGFNYAAATAPGPEIRLTQDGNSFFAAWAPDSATLLITRSGAIKPLSRGWQVIYELWKIELEKNKASRLADNAVYPAYAPDGRSIAYLSFVDDKSAELWRLDTASGNKARVAEADWGLPPTWQPGGRLVFVQGGYLATADSKGAVAIQSMAPEELFALAPTASALAKSDGSKLWVGKQGEETLIASADFIGPFVWSPRGDRIAYLTIDSNSRPRLWVARADGSRVSLVLEGFETEHWGAPSWSPDGRSLALSRCPSGSASSSACDIWLVGADGSDLTDLTPGHREETSPVWSPDGKWLAFQREGDVWLLDVEQAKNPPPPSPAPPLQPLLLEPQEAPQAVQAASLTPPTTIRVVHDSQNYYRSNVPPGQIDIFDFETYVKYVIACEVPHTWHAEALKAQAVAARTFGWHYVLTHPISPNWDVNDWTAYQCLREVNFPEVGAAVDATRGQYVAQNGNIIIAMYSAENGDPTLTRDPAKYPYLLAVNDPVSFGRTRWGHGWGMSQEGSQRWASWHGWDYQKILTHYYSGVTVEAPTESGSDTRPPTASVILPWSDYYITSNRTLIVANASDGNSGVKAMDFWAYYDDGDGADWHFLTKDENPSDGWSYLWDLSSIPDQPLTTESIRIAVNAVDQAGNVQLDSRRVALVGLDRAEPQGEVLYYQSIFDPSSVALYPHASDEEMGGGYKVLVSHNWLWEGEELSHRTGEEIADVAALNGRAWQGRAGVHPAGHWYGPYTFDLAPGRYRAYFRLKTNNVTTTSEIARLDVVDNWGNRVLGLLPLRGIDFEAPDTYQEFGVDIYYPNIGDYGLEFRTYFRGTADLVLDRVVIVGYPQGGSGLIAELSPGESAEDLIVKLLDVAGNISNDMGASPLSMPYRQVFPFIVKGAQ